METTLLARHAQPLPSRREFLGTAGAATLALAPLPALADSTIRLPLPGGPDERSITTAFPEKGALILQRTRPPLLETPFEVFDGSDSRPTIGSTCVGTGRSSRPKSTSRPSG
jgi:hypothetical protein